MKNHLFTFLICLSLLAPNLSYADTKDAIVKIFTTSVTYDYDSPWQTSGTEESTGSGSVISGQRILTNAHIISNATYIEVQRNGDPRHFVARVLAAASVPRLHISAEQQPKGNWRI